MHYRKTTINFLKRVHLYAGGCFYCFSRLLFAHSSIRLLIVLHIQWPLLAKRIFQCLSLKPDRKPSPVVNINVDCFLSGDWQPHKAWQSLPGNNPWNICSLTNLIVISMASFACNCFVCQDSQFICSQVWNNHRLYIEKWPKNDLITYGMHCRMIGGKHTLEREGSKWAVTLNDTGILF